MAEVILPPIETEPELPEEQLPEVDKPTELSKVITVKFNPLDTGMTSTANTRQSFYTTDTDAWITFEIEKMDAPNGEYSLVLYNKSDGSIFQRTGDIVSGAAYYKIEEEEIKHAGDWVGQVVVTLVNGKTTTSRFSFNVAGHLLDGKDVRQIVIQDFETLMKQLNGLKDDAEIDFRTLKNDIEEAQRVAEQNELERVSAENERKQAELLRDETYDSKVDAAIVEADVVTKVDDKVAELSSTIQNVTAQLAQTANGLKPNHSVWSEFEQRGINVNWFGAVADANYFDEVGKKYYSDAAMTKPATNNTQAFQDAIDFLASNGGGTLYIPKGKYVFKSTVYWKSKVSMVGDGVGSTIFYVEGVIFSLFRNTFGAPNGSGTDADFLEDCRFENLEIDLIGLSETAGSVEGKAFFILYMRRARFHNLLLKNTIGTALGCDFLTDTVISNVVVDRAGRNFTAANTGGQSGIGIGSCAIPNEPVIVTNCHVYNCGNYGIFVETQHNPSGVKSQNARIVDCYVDGNRIGIGNKGSGATLISNNSIINSTTHGVHFTQLVKGDMVFNNKITHNGGSGVQIEGDYFGDVIVANNIIHSNAIAGVRVMRNQKPEKVRNVEILGNVIFDNGSNGVWLQGQIIGFKVSNNTIYNNGKNGVSSQTSAVAMETEITSGLILGNLIYDNQAVKTQITGIRFSSTVISDSLKIGENHIIGYTPSNSIQLNGTNVKLNIDGNTGYITKISGTASIPEGADNVDVSHGLPSTPKVVIVTPRSNAPIWSRYRDGSIIKIGRTGTTGAVAFDWYAEV